MPLESAPQRGLSIDTNSLIGRADPNIVTPQNTAMLTDAFHKGFITADDIVQRVGERAKAKEKLDITKMGQEQTDLDDPELQDARKAIAIAHGATAKAQQKELARKEELAPLVQRAARAKTIWDIMNSEEFGEADRTKAAHEAAGIPIPKTDEGFIDFPKARENSAKIRQWADSARQATAILQTVEKEKRKLKTASGAEVEGEVKFSPVLGRELSDAEVMQLNRRATQNFSEFQAQSKPIVAPTAAPASADMVQPAAVPSAPSAPVPTVAPAQAEQSPEAYLTSQLSALGLTPEEWSVALNTFRSSGGDQATAENIVRAWTVNTAGRAAPSAPVVIEPVTAATAPISDLITPRPGQILPGVGRIMSVTEAAPREYKAPTEVQSRALNALARFTESEEILKGVIERGYDPTAIFGYIENILPNILKSGDRQAFELAASAWNQGLLRLESGAAISRHEEAWYNRAFFPQPGDSSEVVTEKTKLRQNIEKVVAQEAAAGGVSPELKEVARKAYERAEQIVPTGSAAPAGGKQTAVVNGQKWTVQIGPDGKRKYFRE